MAIFHPTTGERLDTEVENVVTEPKSADAKPAAQADSNPAEKPGKTKSADAKPAASKES